ncbi:MAG TPA: hypothetical protein VHM70_22035 [Polyangiaceae bacterium]|nr:hypothetical protein [Polyangiaceae bacterium]
MRTMHLSCMALLFCAACQNAADTTSQPAKPVELQPAAVSEDGIQRSDIAVPEDFEDEAYAQIDEDNLDQQVDTLEREINSDAD